MAKVLPPAAAVMVGAPPQLLTPFGVAAIIRPAVNASLKVRPVLAGDPAGLVMAKLSVEGCPTPAVVGATALSTDGRDCTLSEIAVPLLVMRAGQAIVAVLLVDGASRLMMMP